MENMTAALKAGLNTHTVGDRIYDFIAELFPIHRSITGNGVRETLRHIERRIPLRMCEVPSGTNVFDWTVPKEWNIDDAYVKNSKGERVIDFRRSNLQVVNYSSPVKQKLTLRDLKDHLFTLPEYPDWIPYKTSYFKETWGFCVSHKQFLELEEDAEYEVCIDSRLEEGALTYGEYYLQGERTDEIVISCHICHPSLCNDNLSGIAMAVFLAEHLTSVQRRHSFRFLFIPGTIGSIAWLALNEEKVSRIKHGLILSCLGDPGPSTYKKSRRGDAAIDKAASHVLKHAGSPYEVVEFVPYGYDERQFCSPGFNLPFGCIMRTPNGCYPQYHTSADDLNFVKPDYLTDSFTKCLGILEVLEHDRVYINQNPRCEPQLGRRGIYRGWSSQGLPGDDLAVLWVLNLSDGSHSLLDIAERAGLSFETIKRVADLLIAHDLLAPAEGCGP